MSLLPQSAQTIERGWAALLEISELTSAFTTHQPSITPDAVMHFMVSDTSNPSSIMRCLQGARENARAVRGSITTELWETINTTWLDAQRLMGEGILKSAPAEFFEWVKFRSHLSRGVTVGTMLQDEAFHFLRIGSFLERADNTARLLDVKFHAVGTEFFEGMPRAAAGLAQSQAQSEGQGADARDMEYDFYHWSAILRSVSAFEVYRKVYRNVIRPEKVAELLILRPDMPRSLHACMNEVVANLDLVAGGGMSSTQRYAGKLHADLQYGKIDEILKTGLHTFLTEFLDRVNDIGSRISRDYLMPQAA
jgi:uncharacterized alpha-E superfamily protein